MESVGVELELGVLLVLAVLGTEIFAAFEVETPAWKKIFKWSVTIGITLGLYPVIGHWASVFPLVFALMGLAVHFSWCSKNNIHPIRATPRRRYYELRGWEWHE